MSIPLTADQLPDKYRNGWVSNRIASGLLIAPETGGVGTLGCLVFDRQTLEPRALTVAHLFDRVGEAVYYPPEVGVPNPANKLGEVTFWNTDWDLALFSLQNPARPLFQGLTQQNNIGAIPQGTALRAYLQTGMNLGKMGGVTGYTGGTIQACGPNTMPSNPTPPNWRQFFCVYPLAGEGDLSKPGDSGSMWFDSTTLLACGLHQSGDQGKVAIVIPMDPVLELGGVFLDHGITYLGISATWISTNGPGGASGTITMTYIGPDLRLYQMLAKYTLNLGPFILTNWSPPISLPLPAPGLTGACGVFLEYLSLTYIFTRDRAAHVLMYQVLGSSNWISLAFPITSDPAVTSYYIDNNAMVFACARDRRGGLSYMYASLPATGPQSWSNVNSAPDLPANLTIVGSPAVVVQGGVTRLQVFVRAVDNAIYYNAFDCKLGSWDQWAAITATGVAGSSPRAGAVQTPGSGHSAPTYVYYRSIDCRIQQTQSMYGYVAEFKNNWRSLAVSGRPIYDLAVAFTPLAHLLVFETPEGMRTQAFMIANNALSGFLATVGTATLIGYQALPNVVWPAAPITNVRRWFRRANLRSSPSLIAQLWQRFRAWWRK